MTLDFRNRTLVVQKSGRKFFFPQSKEKIIQKELNLEGLELRKKHQKNKCTFFRIFRKNEIPNAVDEQKRVPPPIHAGERELTAPSVLRALRVNSGIYLPHLQRRETKRTILLSRKLGSITYCQGTIDQKT